MLVLSVAYPLFPVSAESAGGAEQILYSVERGLVAAGHRSLVVSAPGSSVSGHLLAGARARAIITDQDQSDAQKQHQAQIESVLRGYSVDLVHYHGLDFSNYAPDTDVPAIATLHLPPGWYAPEAFQTKNVEFVCVSRSQHAALPAGVRATVIGNGVDPIGMASDSRREDLLWLGRICPEKGPDIALRVAHRLGIGLTVAGPVHGFAFHQQYFQEQVRPLLDDRRVYIGPVARPDKIRLVQQARAVLIPSLAPETSSLVAMEAITAGTPVVAFRSGALPEVIENGVTGFVVSDEAAMAEAVLHVNELQPRPSLFSAERMVNEYIALYERVITSRSLGVTSAPQEAL